MSTNFYIARGQNRVEHIGKRAGGITFMFNGRRNRTHSNWVIELSSPVAFHGKGVRIVDEYGRRYSPNEMLEVIEQTKQPWGPSGRTPRVEHGGRDDHRNWVDNGFSFSNYEFE